MLIKLRTATGKTQLRNYDKIDISETLIKFFNSVDEYASILFSKGIATTITVSSSGTKAGCVSADIEGYSIALNITSYESLANLLGEKQTTALLKSKVKASQQHTQLVKSNKPSKDSRDLKALVKQRTAKPDANKQKVLQELYKINAKDAYQELMKSGCDLKDLIIVDESANGLLVKFRGSVAEMLIDDPDTIAAIKAFQ